MRRTKVLLVSLPRLLETMVLDVLARDPDIEVVASRTPGAFAPKDILSLGVDVLIAPENDKGGLTDALLAAPNRLRIVSLAEGGRSAHIQRVVRAHAHIAELSVADLIEVAHGHPLNAADWEIETP